MPDRLDCVRTDELIPELAFGIAAGDERAPALGHLARCVRCRGDLQSATAVADGLLLLTPEREPPPGFESRVLAGLSGPAGAAAPARHGGPAPRRARLRTGSLRRGSLRTVSLRTVSLRAAAVVLTAAIAGLAVWWRTGADRDLAAGYRHTLAVAHGRYLRAAPLLAPPTSPAGQMFAYEGQPSWILVIVRGAAVPGRYDVRLTTRDGRQFTLGTMTVERGQGSWQATIGIPVDRIAAVTLTCPGAQLTARL